MHRTPSGDRRKSLQKEARELARDARALQKVAQHLPAAAERQKARERNEGGGAGDGTRWIVP